MRLSLKTITRQKNLEIYVGTSCHDPCFSLSRATWWRFEQAMAGLAPLRVISKREKCGQGELAVGGGLTFVECNLCVFPIAKVSLFFSCQKYSLTLHTTLKKLYKNVNALFFLDCQKLEISTDIHNL